MATTSSSLHLPAPQQDQQQPTKMEHSAVGETSSIPLIPMTPATGLHETQQPTDVTSSAVAAPPSGEALPAPTTVEKTTATAVTIRAGSDETPNNVTIPTAPNDTPVAESDAESKTAVLSPPPQITATPSALTITILMQSSIKHAFVLNEEFLERHSAHLSSGKPVIDPFDLTVLQFKECIWKDWKEDWDQRPASALFIKLIQFGAYLNDSNLLRECRFAVGGSNVIHMAIRPAEVGDDDMTQRSTKGGACGPSRDRETTRRTSSCRCVIL